MRSGQVEGEPQGAGFKLSDVLTPEHLQMIAQASGGFSLGEAPWLPSGRMGYTDLRIRRIYINPLYLQHLNRRALEGFLYHEAGHHSPEVLQFSNKLLHNLGNKDIIPPAYQGTPEAETRFFESLHSHLHNGLVDIWLESFITRRPYYNIRESIHSAHSVEENRPLRLLSKPDQLLQLFVHEDVYGSNVPVQQLVEEDVYEAYLRIKSSGAIDVLHDRRAFENYFATEADKNRILNRKYAAYEQVFLPEYLKLLEAELEERKKQRCQGKGTPIRVGAILQGSDAVPLTQEEIQELIDEILAELREAGKEFESKAPSDETERLKKDVLDAVRRALEERKSQLEQGQQPQPTNREPRRKTGEEALRDLAEQLQSQEMQRQVRGLAEAMKVRQESVKTWKRIKEKYRLEIESTAAALSEVFLDDRRKKIDYLRREGEIVPGLEYETIAALLSGELDPDTKMQIVRNPEFLETELEFIVDTSGSMGGLPIERSVEFVVIVTEAFKKVREDLAGEDLLLEDEQPFRIGVTTFSTVPERVTKLDEPLSDEKELIIIDRTARAGGGTSETKTIEEVYGQLSLGSSSVIKIIIVLSDGIGDRQGVWPIMRQIEEDDEVIFLVSALGQTDEQATGVVETYLEPLKDREKNVFGIIAVNPNEILPQGLDFLKREVLKKRTF